MEFGFFLRLQFHRDFLRCAGPARAGDRGYSDAGEFYYGGGVCHAGDGVAGEENKIVQHLK